MCPRQVQAMVLHVMFSISGLSHAPAVVLHVIALVPHVTCCSRPSQPRILAKLTDGKHFGRERGGVFFTNKRWRVGRIDRASMGSVPSWQRCEVARVCSGRGEQTVCSHIGCYRRCLGSPRTRTTRHLKSQVSMALGMRAKPGVCTDAPRQIESEASMAPGMRPKTGSSSGSSRLSEPHRQCSDEGSEAGWWNLEAWPFHSFMELQPSYTSAPPLDALIDRCSWRDSASTPALTSFQFHVRCAHNDFHNDT